MQDEMSDRHRFRNYSVCMMSICAHDLRGDLGDSGGGSDCGPCWCMRCVTLPDSLRPSVWDQSNGLSGRWKLCREKFPAGKPPVNPGDRGGGGPVTGKYSAPRYPRGPVAPSTGEPGRDDAGEPKPGGGVIIPIMVSFPYITPPPCSSPNSARSLKLAKSISSS